MACEKNQINADQQCDSLRGLCREAGFSLASDFAVVFCVELLCV